MQSTRRNGPCIRVVTLATAAVVAVLLGPPVPRWATASPTGAAPSSRGFLPAPNAYVHPTWTATADGLFLWQANTASRPLLSFFDGSARGTTALDANQLVPSISAGPRIDLMRRFDPCWSLQADYFNVTPFEASRGAAGSPELAEDDLAGFSDTGFESATATTSGKVQSAELNLRRRSPGSSTTLLAGFRWVEVDQVLSIGEADVAPDPFQSTFLSRVGNDLYGGQVGFDSLLWNNLRGPLRVNAVGKAGIYGNVARQSLAYRDSDGFALELGATESEAAFFGEAGVNASLRVTPWLEARCGYTLLWASGIAIPAGQFSANDFTTGVAGVDTTGSLLLHGFTVGAEVRW
jgi:hypothetical protein